MTNQILITIAGAALSGPVIPQMWTCNACGQEMDITSGLAHILYDCPQDNPDPALAEYQHIKKQWANRPEAESQADE